MASESVVKENVVFDTARIQSLLQRLEQMACGDLELRIPVSEQRDELDAVAHAINVLCEELLYATKREAEALREAMEAAEAADRTKSMLLRSVSHELRTPLTAIQGLSEALQRPTVEHRERLDLTGRILFNTDTLRNLVDDLLDVSRAEAGMLPIKSEVVQLRTLLENIADAVATPLQKSNIRFNWTLTAHVPECISTDGNRLRQVLLNLIGNAIKFTDRGSIELRGETMDRDGDTAQGANTRLVLRVSDTGQGISPEDQAHLFEPFFRGNTGHVEGVGLGLMLSRNLVELMNGHLILESSQQGLGSVFMVDLPLIPAQQENRQGAGQSAPAVLDLEGRHLMIAEDNDDIAMFLELVLTSAGATVSRANDGLALLETPNLQAFDCILLDIRMPRLDGLGALKVLRARGFTGKIVAVSADADPKQREECLAAGCDGFMTKPVSVDDLVEMCHTMTKGPE